MKNWGRGEYVSMKLTPMKSFLTRTCPSFGVGTGRSVLYSSTSTPPVFSMRTPLMVLGIEVAILRGKWLLICLSRRVGWNFEVSSRVAYLADMQMLLDLRVKKKQAIA